MWEVEEVPPFAGGDHKDKVFRKTELRNIVRIPNIWGGLWNILDSEDEF